MGISLMLNAGDRAGEIGGGMRLEAVSSSRKLIENDDNTYGNVIVCEVEHTSRRVGALSL